MSTEVSLAPNVAFKLRSQVMCYMKENIHDHYDMETGKINATSLAEDAAQHFDLYIGDEIPTQLFEWSYDTAVDWERRHY